MIPEDKLSRQVQELNNVLCKSLPDLKEEIRKVLEHPALIKIEFFSNDHEAEPTVDIKLFFNRYEMVTVK